MENRYLRKTRQPSHVENADKDHRKEMDVSIKNDQKQASHLTPHSTPHNDIVKDPHVVQVSEANLEITAEDAVDHRDDEQENTEKVDAQEEIGDEAQDPQKVVLNASSEEYHSLQHETTHGKQRNAGYQHHQRHHEHKGHGYHYHGNFVPIVDGEEVSETTYIETMCKRLLDGKDNYTQHLFGIDALRILCLADISDSMVQNSKTSNAFIMLESGCMDVVFGAFEEFKTSDEMLCCTFHFLATLLLATSTQEKVLRMRDGVLLTTVSALMKEHASLPHVQQYACRLLSSIAINPTSADTLVVHPVMENVFEACESHASKNSFLNNACNLIKMLAGASADVRGYLYSNHKVCRLLLKILSSETTNEKVAREVYWAINLIAYNEYACAEIVELNGYSIMVRAMTQYHDRLLHSMGVSALGTIATTVKLDTRMADILDDGLTVKDILDKLQGMDISNEAVVESLRELEGMVSGSTWIQRRYNITISNTVITAVIRAMDRFHNDEAVQANVFYLLHLLSPKPPQ
eukprot:m.51160 g.51160  ORF g.51160 m.51160 type:complete len:520 (+) comp7548_c0_seq1:67-1626(+)